MTLQKRIYLSMILLILASFVIIGAITIWYTQHENEEYHIKRLARKERAVNVSLKYFLTERKNDPLTFYSRDFYIKIKELADVNKLDINIYDLDGQWVSSSDFDFLDLGYIPSELSDKVMQELRTERGSVTEGLIGEEKYLYALKYLENSAGEPLAIINIAYYRSEQEFKEETSLFLKAITQVYALMLVVGFIIAYLLSNSITKGLKRLEDKINQLSLAEDQNQEMEWEANDEIGSLVDAYNLKVRELQMSVEKLAQSEREGAWREMAKQVAHEIKNPLTPMLLQVQQLERSWKDGREDFPERLERFRILMQEQIETLSRIATEFSNFAKLPEAQMQAVSINSEVKQTCALFTQGETHEVSCNLPAEEVYVYADKNQMHRVFNNLLTNAMHAIEGLEHGKVSIGVESNEDQITVQITDNGVGIAEHELEYIFEPNFTTKTSGTGLGLAMVRSIIQNINGYISVTSTVGEGSTFVLTLPRYKNESNEL